MTLDLGNKSCTKLGFFIFAKVYIHLYAEAGNVGRICIIICIYMHILTTAVVRQWQCYASGKVECSEKASEYLIMYTACPPQPHPVDHVYKSIDTVW